MIYLRECIIYGTLTGLKRFILCWNGFSYQCHQHTRAEDATDMLPRLCAKMLKTCENVFKKFNSKASDFKAALFVTFVSVTTFLWVSRRRWCEDFTRSWPRNREAATGSLTRNRCEWSEWHVCLKKNKKLQSPAEGLQTRLSRRLLMEWNMSSKNLWRRTQRLVLEWVSVSFILGASCGV